MTSIKGFCLPYINELTTPEQQEEPRPEHPTPSSLRSKGRPLVVMGLSSTRRLLLEPSSVPTEQADRGMGR